MSLKETIDLEVDVLNDGDTVSEELIRFESPLNRSVYIASSTHSLVSKDQLTFYRTFPKPTGNFNGVAKCSFKFSKDMLVNAPDSMTTVKAPLIVEVSFSIPVGATPAQTLVARQRALALLDDDSIMGPLCDQQMV